MAFDTIKKDLPGLVEECSSFCELVEEIYPFVKSHHLDNKPLPDVMKNIIDNPAQYYIERQITQAVRTLRTLENDLLNSEINPNKKLNGELIGMMNEKSKTCYNELIKHTKKFDNTIKNLYFFPNKEIRNKLVVIASASIAYSERAIHLADKYEIKKNYAKNHYRNGNCFNFLDSHKASQEYNLVIQFGLPFLEKYKDREDFPTLKLIETGESVVQAYNQLNRQDESYKVNKIVDALKNKQKAATKGLLE